MNKFSTKSYLEERNKHNLKELVNEIVTDEFLSKCIPVSLLYMNEDELKSFSLIKTREERAEALKELRSVNNYKAVDHLVSTDMAKIKNREEITEEDVDGILNPVSVDELKHKRDAIIQMILNNIVRIVKDEYVLTRNNGESDDYSVTSDEIIAIRTLVDNFLVRSKLLSSSVGKDFTDKELGSFFSERELESKMRYEQTKEVICNMFGKDPDSYDEFVKAVEIKQQQYLKEVGIKHPNDLIRVYDKHALECKHLLKDYPNAAEIVNNGEFIYRSSFLLFAGKKYQESIKDYQSKSSKESIELFKSMGTLYKDTLFSGLGDDSTSKKAEKFNNSRTAHKKSLADKIAAKKQERLKELSKETPKETIKEEVKAEEVSNDDINLLIDQNKTESVSEHTADNKNVSNEENDIISELVEEYNKESAKEFNRTEEHILKELTPKVDVSSKPKVSRKLSDIEFEDVFKLNVHQADVSILSSTMSPAERLRAYKASHKRSRSIFLPNSNYEVNVLRTIDETTLKYTLSLLKDTNDIDTNNTVKLELLQVLFNSLEFNTQTSFKTFLKSTHESDISLLFMMWAIVNGPLVDKEESYVDIYYLMCSKCKTIANLKEPIKLNVKNEFSNIYPIDVYNDKYAAYKTAEYNSIELAYRKSKVGKPLKLVLNDPENIMKYSVIFSLPNLYKTYDVESGFKQVVYSIGLEELINTNDNMDLDADIRAKNQKLADYMGRHSFSTLKTRYNAIQPQIEGVNKEDVPTELLAEYNSYVEEMDLINRASIIINNTEQTLLPVKNICKIIDRIDILANDENQTPIVSNINQEDLYGMVVSIMDMPETVLQKLSDEILTVISNEDSMITRYDISFDSTELEDKFEWDRYYNYDYSKGEVVSEEEILDLYVDDNEEDRNNRRSIRSKMRSNMDAGLCVCGHDKFIVNYTNLLFFSISKRLGVVE